MTLFVFQFDIYGSDDNDLQFENIKLISRTFLVFHFDISGNDDNDKQFEKIELKSR